MRVGQVGPLLAARSEPDAPPAARGEGVEPLHRLPSGVLRVLERIGERRQALKAVGLHHRQVAHQNADQRQQPGEKPCGRPDHPQQSHQDRDEHQGRPEVGLEHDEPGDHGGDRQQRDQQVAPFAEPAPLAYEQVGAPEREPQFGQLAGLQGQGSDADPAGGAVCRDTDARHQHQQQPADADKQQRIRQQSECPGGHPAGDHQRGESDPDPHELLDKDRERGAGPRVRRDARRRKDHHQPEAEQQRAGRSDQVVRGHRPGEHRHALRVSVDRARIHAADGPRRRARRADA